MAGVIDTIYTFRFLKILSTKWENTDAYKLGIIDEDGTPLKKSGDLTTTAEKKAYTPFVRLVFKFKRIMNKVPGGKSAVARYGTALLLIKENKEEVENMGINLRKLEEGLKKYIGDVPNAVEEGFVVKVGGGKVPVGNWKFKYNAKKKRDLEMIIQSAIGRGMDVDDADRGVYVDGSANDHMSLIRSLKSLNIAGMVTEEVTNTTGGIEGKEQPLGKKGEVKKRKKKKEDDVSNKEGVEENEEVSYKYQMIGGTLIRVDEVKRVVKKRIRNGKRQKKREYVPTKRKTKTGGRKLRGGAKAKFVRAHKKAYRKAKTGSAKAKRRRSMKKSRRYGNKKKK